MAKKVLAITGSYRRGGMIDQAVAEAAAGAREAGAEVDVISLLDKHIEFCTNCRACTQAPGEKRGVCVHNDDMGSILDAIEASDGLIVGAPVNFYNVNALTRRFMERLVVYGYWPWTQGGPKFRLKEAKKAVVITSCAAPALLGRVFFSGAVKALKALAKTVGAKTEASLLIGLSGGEHPALSKTEAAAARKLGRRVAG